jgi:hypothetical protein
MRQSVPFIVVLAAITSSTGAAGARTSKTPVLRPEKYGLHGAVGSGKVRPATIDLA